MGGNVDGVGRLPKTGPNSSSMDASAAFGSMAVKESEHTNLPKRNASGEVLSGVSPGLCTIEAGREGPGNTRGYSGRLLGKEKKVRVDVSRVNLDSVRTGMPPTTKLDSIGQGVIFTGRAKVGKVPLAGDSSEPARHSHLGEWG